MCGLGIDVGTGSISLAVLKDGKLIYEAYRLHKGQIGETLTEMLAELKKECPGERFYAAASSAAVYLYPKIGKEAVPDRMQALLEGAAILSPDAESIMEMGAQTSCYVTGLKHRETLAYAMNGECAAGTGSFFEDQMYRLGLPLDAYSDYVAKAQSVPRLAGRCSVFAKTDLIHRQQEGVPVSDILLGLSYAVVRNFKAAVVRRLPVRKPLLVAGGVVENEGVRRAVLEIFDLKDDELIFEKSGRILSAVGLASLAEKRKTEFDWEHPKKREAAVVTQKKSLPVYPYDKAALHPVRSRIAGEKLWLGIDVGSTSTNLLLAGENGEVLDYQYLRTKGDPAGAVNAGLLHFREKYGEDLSYAGIGVTGSGRYLIAKQTGAKTVVDEITAQARAATWQFADVDTVFEIGGQDSKYISIRNGQVVDFAMNKVCAAGTGSFVEEQAGRLKVDLEEIGEQALASRIPVDLGERCTVLMESKIASELAEGTDTADICAGLCRSIVRNYADRVVGNKKVGKVISLQGGIVHNKGIVSAFYEIFGDRIRIAPYYDVTGAYGAALEARAAADIRETDFARNEEVYTKSREWFYAGYDGVLKPGKKTVGIPRSLMIYKFFPMAYQFFHTLGFNVLLSPETDEKIIALSQEVTQEETCYPVKLLHGHMEYLARAGVDYIFIPRIRTIRHEKSYVEHNYGCVYMQTAPELAAAALGIKERGITLVSPLLDLDMGKPQLAGAMIQAGMSLGKEKPLCAAALAKGAAAMALCDKKSEKLGKDFLDTLKPEDKVLVLITRNYGISDPVLNMQIPNELLKRGCMVLNLSHLAGHSLDLSEEYPNLYWPFGQHILSGAKIIRDHPNLYAVYLTNHGCGPDGMISHLFGEIMGDKPYLSVEVDEHQSTVGVVTRIEAFLNSLKYVENQKAGQSDGKDPAQAGKKVGMSGQKAKDRPLYLPPFSVYSRWYAAYLNGTGTRTEVLPDYEAADLKAGHGERMAKEYVTHTALLGQTLRLAERTGKNAQMLLFLTEGAEADGMTAQVVKSVLDKKKLSSLSLYTPYVERLLEREEADTLWQILLLGDAFGYLPQERKKEAEDEIGKLIKFPLKWENTRALIEKWHGQVKAGRRILISGEPMLLHSPYLNRGLFAAVEEKGLTPVVMPLSEYLWFYIRESGKTVDPWFTETLEEFERAYEDVLGAFHPLEERFAGLDVYPRVTGASIRYLAAQSTVLIPQGVGNILVTPAYGNYASVIEMMRKESPVLYFHFQVDGNGEPEEIEKREIFLNLAAE